VLVLSALLEPLNQLQETLHRVQIAQLARIKHPQVSHLVRLVQSAFTKLLRVNLHALQQPTLAALVREPYQVLHHLLMDVQTVSLARIRILLLRTR
jgi:predicted XRE-type DNA-binding protein